MAALTALANVTIASNALTVAFSSISGSYRDLYLVMNVKTDSFSNVEMTINGSGSHSSVLMRGNGSAAASSTHSAGNIQVGKDVFIRTDNFTNRIIEILDYAATDKYKTFFIRAEDPSSPMAEVQGGYWGASSAITSLTFTVAGAGNFVPGSTFALYGVAA